MRKLIKRFLLLISLILTLIIIYYVYYGYCDYKNAIESESIAEKIAEIKNEKENYTSFSELPENYVNAVIAVEDRRFFKHNGLDIISIGRAVFKNISQKKLVEGGSTITQQLAKNIYFTQEKTLIRKIAEVFMAIQIEKECSKEEIFELYVNTSYFGDGYYCIKDASRGYFNKEPSEMDLYECTLLAGIPNAPSVYAPTKNPDLAKQRQAQVLNKMLKYEYLTKEQYQSVINLEYNM